MVSESIPISQEQLTKLHNTRLLLTSLNFCQVVVAKFFKVENCTGQSVSRKLYLSSHPNASAGNFKGDGTGMEVCG